MIRKMKFSILQEEWLSLGNMSAIEGLFIILDVPASQERPQPPIRGIFDAEMFIGP